MNDARSHFPPHSFLVAEGRWTAEGTTITTDNRAYPASGESVVVHKPDVWLLESALTVASSPPATHRNVYEIQPFDPVIGISEWTADNEDLGRLVGRLLIIDDVIHLQFHAPGGEHSGVERMRLLHNGDYEVTGSLFEGARRLSQWDVTLRRAPLS